MSERREWWIIEDGPQQIARTRKLYDRATIHVREVLPGDDELTNYQLQSALMQLQDDHAKLVEAAKYVQLHADQLISMLLELECDEDEWLIERTGTDIVKEVDAMAAQLRKALEEDK